MREAEHRAAFDARVAEVARMSQEAIDAAIAANDEEAAKNLRLKQIDEENKIKAEEAERQRQQKELVDAAKFSAQSALEAAARKSIPASG